MDINHSETGNVVVRDGNALDAAINRPFQSAFGEDAYPSLVVKAAVLLHGIVMAHAFIDGNKRTGWTSCVTFLALNGMQVDDTGDAGPMVRNLVEQQQDHLPAAFYLLQRVRQQ